MKRKTTPLTTAATAAHLTWKQHDVLILLNDGPMNPDELSAIMHEIRDDDLANNEPIFYIAVNATSIYSTLRSLDRRGLVERGGDDGQWQLTRDGKRAIRDYI